MSLEQHVDRVIGTLQGGAIGDALGVPYEYGSRRLDGEPAMVGGGLGHYAPGQWSDDTEMAAVIARVAATRADLRTEEALDAIADGFVDWYRGGPADVGSQTATVLSAQEPGPGSAARLRAAATAVHRRTGRSGGNGSLMRTGPVALAHLGDRDAITTAARAVSELTHHDPQAGDACVLWCLAIDHAIATGRADARVGLSHLPDDEARRWDALLDAAEASGPGAFAGTNGWVVAALQGAWAAVAGAADAEAGLVAAVRGGGDTDTVAAIAGALLGAASGASAFRAEWRDRVHGWPGLRASDLADLATAATRP
ncbi:ADP-ribosylglycohydrolase family protein [Actinomycetospora soli]|uniref:ADP-ribosylglycohydrolase family protein n=1 Tax=Actinomycetospora soli TaxID=2893887 RepID=UPI001E5A9424|nr:ADP-ribosylglycohydrolase family protein [Actinomycetospora soli]MCD2189820.1 ADP-ribosylglycohydrolase family protein [Actinomycetospora soli]